MGIDNPLVLLVDSIRRLQKLYWLENDSLTVVYSENPLLDDVVCLDIESTTLFSTTVARLSASLLVWKVNHKTDIDIKLKEIAPYAQTILNILAVKKHSCNFKTVGIEVSNSYHIRYERSYNSILDITRQ